MSQITSGKKLFILNLILNFILMPWLMSACAINNPLPINSEAGTLDAGTPDAGTPRNFDSSLSTNRDFSSPSASDATSLTSVKFILRNKSSQTIYLQNGEYPLWLEIIDEKNNSFVLFESCGTCNCGQGCGGICGVSLATVEAIEANKSAEQVWSGQQWKQKIISSGQYCEYAEMVSGNIFTAKVCYGTGYEEQTGGRYITNKKCQTRSLDLRTEREIVFEVRD